MKIKDGLRRWEAMGIHQCIVETYVPDLRMTIIETGSYVYMMLMRYNNRGIPTSSKGLLKTAIHPKTVCY